MKPVIIFCDGSSIGNPGPGGWGAVVILSSEKVQELGGYEEHTTNNRMELTAALKALEILPKDSTVIIKTDSAYVIRGVTKWVYGWEKNGWQTKEKKDVQNRDLWEALVAEARTRAVTWEHVRAHAGVFLNERVDQVANGFARKEQVRLFAGTQKAYDDFLKDMPKARVVSSSGRSGKAYAYVSLVDGVCESHPTWTECEKRVKGKNARFKKVFSKEEEEALKREWCP